MSNADLLFADALDLQLRRLHEVRRALRIGGAAPGVEALEALLQDYVAGLRAGTAEDLPAAERATAEATLAAIRAGLDILERGLPTR